MDLGGRPLLDSLADSRLFAGRSAELKRLTSNVRNRHNVLLIGERGSGKTSLLRQTQRKLRAGLPKELAPAFVEGRLAESLTTFLDLVRIRLGLAPLVREPTPLQISVNALRGQGRPALEDSLELPSLVSSLRQAVPDEAWRAVLVDEMPSKAIAQTLFGRLRDELWQVPLTWVVAVSESDAGALLQPPADAFFDVVLNMEPLGRRQQEELLLARAGDAGHQLSEMIDEGNPRRLLALARDVTQENSRDGLFRVVNERQAVVARLGRSANMLLAELDAMGPVSASDERLLASLGWTRERAVQVFRKLEREGIVVSSNVKGETGRPRKVYRLADVFPSETGDVK